MTTPATEVAAEAMEAEVAVAMECGAPTTTPLLTTRMSVGVAQE